MTEMDRLMERSKRSDRMSWGGRAIFTDCSHCWRDRKCLVLWRDGTTFYHVEKEGATPEYWCYSCFDSTNTGLEEMLSGPIYGTQPATMRTPPFDQVMRYLREGKTKGLFRKPKWAV